MKARLLLLFCCCLSGAMLSAQPVAIRAGHLIDPVTGNVSDNQVIFVKEGKITAVGGDVKIPNVVRTIDLSGAWVMPGLMDAHTHLLLVESGPGGLETVYMKQTTGLRVLLGAHNAESVLMAGFTTVKDVGNSANYGDVDLRKGIERGWVPGPTMLTAGKIIAAFGGQARSVSPEQGRIWQYEYIDADSPDEVRKAVREDIFYGANTIKLVADHSRFFYSKEEIQAAVTEAHNAGYTVAVHVGGEEAARNAIMAGAESIEHGFDLSDELLKLMKEKGTYLVGTDFPEAHLKAMNYNAVRDGMTMAERIIDRLRRAYKIGVKLAFGSDIVTELSGKNRGEMMMDYLDVWLAAGIPPAEILKAWSTNGAELMHVQSKRGYIKEGLSADIIATPENPLKDVHALRNVSFVMKEGKIYKGEK